MEIVTVVFFACVLRFLLYGKCMENLRRSMENLWKCMEMTKDLTEFAKIYGHVLKIYENVLENLWKFMEMY